MQKVGFILILLMSFSLVSALPQYNNPSSMIEVPNTFLDLTDTPNSYSGQSGMCTKVNALETGLEFGVCGNGSSSGTTRNIFDQDLNKSNDVLFTNLNISNGGTDCYFGTSLEYFGVDVMCQNDDINIYSKTGSSTFGYPSSTTTLRGEINIEEYLNSNVIPLVSDSLSLGTSSLRWLSINVKEVVSDTLTTSRINTTSINVSVLYDASGLGYTLNQLNQTGSSNSLPNLTETNGNIAYSGLGNFTINLASAVLTRIVGFTNIGSGDCGVFQWGDAFNRIGVCYNEPVWINGYHGLLIYGAGKDSGSQMARFGGFNSALTSYIKTSLFIGKNSTARTGYILDIYGNTWMDGNVSINGSIVANNICYSNGTGCSVSSGMDYTNIAMTNQTNSFTETNYFNNSIITQNGYYFSVINDPTQEVSARFGYDDLVNYTDAYLGHRDWAGAFADNELNTVILSNHTSAISARGNSYFFGNISSSENIWGINLCYANGTNSTGGTCGSSGTVYNNYTNYTYITNNYTNYTNYSITNNNIYNVNGSFVQFNYTTRNTISNVTGNNWNTTMIIPLSANTNYAIDCYLAGNSSIATTGVQLNATFPTGITWQMSSYSHPTTAVADAFVYCANSVSSCPSLSITGVVAGVPIQFHSEVQNINAGNFQMQMRTEISGSVVSIIRGSYCRAEIIT